MNKFLIAIISLAVLFVVSGIFNVVQYNDVRVTKEKLALFESRYGSYEKLTTNLKQAEEAKYKQDHTLIVHIKRGTSESQILSLKSFIENQNGVQSVQYVSAEQALADFKTKHQNDQLTLQALNDLGANPLGAILTINVSDPSVKQALLNIIQSNDKDSIVDKINS